MKSIILILTITLFSLVQAQEIESFYKAKKYLQHVYKKHKFTFYSDCKYSYKDKKNMIDRESCRDNTNIKESTKFNRIAWSEVVPAKKYAQEFSCWHSGDSKCVTAKGKTYKGRKCCKKVSKKFKIMSADMMNLVPTVNNIDDKNEFCVPPSKLGDVARIYFYMEDKYNLKLSTQERDKFHKWSKEDPEDKWEKERKKKILKYKNIKTSYKCSS